MQKNGDAYHLGLVRLKATFFQEILAKIALLRKKCGVARDLTKLFFIFVFYCFMKIE